MYIDYSTDECIWFFNSEQVIRINKDSELYGCVKVDERFAYVLGMLMDKYTFAGIEGSWLKLCYYNRSYDKLN